MDDSSDESSRQHYHPDGLEHLPLDQSGHHKLSFGSSSTTSVKRFAPRKGLSNLFRGRRRKRDEPVLKLQSRSVTSLDSVPPYEHFEADPRDILAIPLPLDATTKFAEPFVMSMMGNNTSTSKGDRRRRTDSPTTDKSDDTISTPLRIPTPNLSPLRFLLKRGSASTLHLSPKKRGGKTETTPTRLTKLQESSTPELDGRAVPSPTPQSTAPPPVFSMSAPSSDHSTITPATLRAHSPPTASTLSPPLSAHTSSRPSTSNSQKPSSIYSPFEKKHTPIPITAPAITPTHMNCYQSHRRILKLPNKHYPVPCMVCKLEDKEQRWKCAFCCLWVCSDCMEALKSVPGRDLRVLVQAQQDKKENHWRAMSGQSSDARTTKGTKVKRKDSSDETIKASEEAKKHRPKERVLPM